MLAALLFGRPARGLVPPLPTPAPNPVDQRIWAATETFLTAHWRRTDGDLEDESEALLVDTHGLPKGAMRPFVGERASAYGEVTILGARQLFNEMGLLGARDSPEAGKSNKVFVDLGSGAGKLVCQAWLELAAPVKSFQADAEPPQVARCVGVELAPSRHRAAVRAWASLSRDPVLFRLLLGPGRKMGSAGAGTGAAGGGDESQASSMEPRSAPPRFVLGSMLDADLFDATHVFVASLCMPAAVLASLAARLGDRCCAPRLEVVALLSPLPAPLPARLEAAHPRAVGAVETSWTKARDETAGLYLYRAVDI